MQAVSYTHLTVCHIYTTAGLYRVKDCVFDSIGCSTCDSSTTINVIPNPVANAGGDQVICYGVVTQLNGTSGGGTNYVWSPPGLFSNPDSFYNNDSSIPLTDPNSGAVSLAFSLSGRFLYVDNPVELNLSLIHIFQRY